MAWPWIDGILQRGGFEMTVGKSETIIIFLPVTMFIVGIVFGYALAGGFNQ